MADTETTTPSVDELQAKSGRLTGDVDSAKKALDVAKKTFADAAKSDPTAVETLLELATAVKASESTISTAERAAKGNETAIAGIRYDEQMTGVLEASLDIKASVTKSVVAWFNDNMGLVEEFSIDTLAITAKMEESGSVAISVKPTGENMPKRPSSGKGGGGGGGPRGKRSVTVNGQSMSCREYVASCGTDASPAAQADIAGDWSGSPVSYTNEAKRLAAKKGDTFN